VLLHPGEIREYSSNYVMNKDICTRDLEKKEGT